VRKLSIVLAGALLLAAVLDYFVFSSRFAVWMVVGAFALILLNVASRSRRNGMAKP
jgi:hypothetical protein